jgi:hypothetical protein
LDTESTAKNNFSKIQELFVNEQIYPEDIQGLDNTFLKQITDIKSSFQDL